MAPRRERRRYGIGIFISKTLLERTGAKLHFSNRNGAVVEVVWNRHQFETGPKFSLSHLPTGPEHFIERLNIIVAGSANP